MILLLDEVNHLGPVDVHREDSEEEEGLEVEVSQEPHDGQEAEVLDWAVKDTKKEAECEHLELKTGFANCIHTCVLQAWTHRDLGEEVLGDAPAFPGQALGYPDLDIQMLGRGHDGPRDHQHVLQALQIKVSKMFS